MEKREKLSIERLVSLLEEELDDPRREGGNLQHKLVDVLAVKQNQGNLYDAMLEYFTWAESDPSEKKQLLTWQYEKHDHGRHCHRKVEVTHDVVIGEDAAMLHTDHAPENFSVVRKIAKALLQNEKTFKGSAPRKSKRASYMPDYARLVIGFPVIDFK